MAATAKRILVVDDSATFRTFLRQLLEGEGYQVTEAPDGSKGLELASHEQFDLVITDVHMPAMSGVEMAAKIRALDRHAATPVFACTAEGAQELMKEAKGAGITAWVLKPPKPKILLAGIRKLLG